MQCPHFDAGECRSCPLMGVPYPRQLAEKQAGVRALLDPVAGVEQWVSPQKPRIEQFRKLVSRARQEGAVSASMLAQIASQARILLAR